MELNVNNFDETIKNGAVLVDFWASWCGPCKMLAPVVEELEKDLSGKVAVGKVNVDDSEEIAMRYRVMSIPTLILFKNGEEVHKIVGFRPKQAILAEIERYI